MAARQVDVPGFTGFGDDAFEFYEGLTADNSRTYWTAHKHVYDTAVRAPMTALLDGLAPVFDATPVIFRPYRDVRFSADKSPYKTAQGAFLEVEPGVGYWISVGADGVTVGGGFHAHDRAQVNRFRGAVDGTAGAALEAVLAKLTKVGFEVGGAQVRTRPRGVPADHPRLDLMRHEYVTVGRHVDDAQSGSPGFVGVLTADWRRVAPLVEWVRRYAPPTN
jgi:uncharacterized protein (TIGR02453 family)